MINHNCVICGEPRPHGARSHWTTCSTNCRVKKKHMLDKVQRRAASAKVCIDRLSVDVPENPYWKAQIKDQLFEVERHINIVRMETSQPAHHEK